MPQHALSPTAQKILDEYLSFALGAPPYLHTPYFNNRRVKIRGGLRACIGKGTPKEIADEAGIIALKKHITISSFSAKQIRLFLNEHSLGIDCSGLVYHIIDAIRKEKKMLPLRKIILFKKTHSILRRILRALRVVENTSVTVFALPENSHIISARDAEPGDILIICGHGKQKNEDHIMLIISTETLPDGTRALSYVHSLAWREDTPEQHGVRTGTITLQHADTPLLAGIWIEQEKTGEKNGTYILAQDALRIELRRLNR